MTGPDTELFERTIGCGEVSESSAADRREVVLTGWVHRRRDLGQLIFVELRDWSGLVQIVFDPSESPQAHSLAEGLRLESVIGVRGTVVPRESPNPRHPTGTVEPRATQINRLFRSSMISILDLPLNPAILHVPDTESPMV